MVSDRRALGERLKRQRERRGVTLAQISQISKGPASLFGALEAGDCSRWPAGVYARAYVRSYAEAIGLSADEVVEEFSQAFGLKPEGGAAPNTMSSAATGGGLRLSLVEESPLDASELPRRAGLAAADGLIGCLIAAVAHTGLGLGLWVTVGFVLAYFVAGRAISDQPLLYWIYFRARVPSARPAPVETAPATADVAPVGDAASTAA